MESCTSGFRNMSSQLQVFPCQIRLILSECATLILISVMIVLILFDSNIMIYNTNIENMMNY